MILTGAAFIHRCYLSMYFTNLDPKILDYVHEHANGEDITMNAVVADYLATRLEPQCSGIHINPRKMTMIEKETSKFLHEFCLLNQDKAIINSYTTY